MKAPQLLIASAFLLTGCHFWPQQTNEPPARPCPNPNVDTTRWVAMAAPECGVILNLPKRYKDEGSNSTGSDSFQHTYRDRFDSVNMFSESEEDVSLAKNRDAAPEDYEGYSTCTETIGGKVSVLTTYRDSATIPGKTRHFRPYVTEARWQLGRNEFVGIRAENATRRSQDEILTALRSVQFIPRSRPLRSKGQSALREYLEIIAAFPTQLAAYLIVIAVGGYFAFRRKARAIALASRRRRLSLATYLALILTPSVLTDFFLFSAPAPALFAFFVMLPSLFYVEYWREKAYGTLVLYVAPIAITFGILYGLLTWYAYLRGRRGESSPGVS